MMSASLLCATEQLVDPLHLHVRNVFVQRVYFTFCFIFRALFYASRVVLVIT